MDKSKLALLLARRQKRLEYWKQQFSHSQATAEAKNTFDATCQTYTRLMMKAAKASTQEEKAECEERFEQLEREFDRQFESFRLFTSNSGVGAIIDN
jgi:creatinine amidohydrolase/Fe(II)-dependent formamide hydrolase-like protein